MGWKQRSYDRLFYNPTFESVNEFAQEQFDGGNDLPAVHQDSGAGTRPRAHLSPI